MKQIAKDNKYATSRICLSEGSSLLSRKSKTRVVKKIDLEVGVPTDWHTGIFKDRTFVSFMNKDILITDTRYAVDLSKKVEYSLKGIDTTDEKVKFLD